MQTEIKTASIRIRLDGGKKIRKEITQIQKDVKKLNRLLEQTAELKERLFTPQIKKDPKEFLQDLVRDLEKHLKRARCDTPKEQS